MYPVETEEKLAGILAGGPSHLCAKIFAFEQESMPKKNVGVCSLYRTKSTAAIEPKKASTR